MSVVRSFLVILGIPCMAAALAACDLGDANQQPPIEVPDADVGVPPPNVEPQLGCAGACHGNETSIAPPKDMQGQTDPSLRTVGAHRSHLNPAPTWHRKLQCTDCHQVPGAVGDPGHIDTPAPAELTFGVIASADGSNPTWNGTTCSNVYCHGGTLPGGTLTTPTWTQLDGTQKACGTCHGYPPPAPHPVNTDCGSCHPTIQPGTTNFLDPESHINGRVDTANGNQACDSCHGGDGVAAPPKDLAGNIDPTSPAVGAHRAHLGPSEWHRELYCSQCHVIPVNVADPGHVDGDNIAELTFDPLNPLGTFDRATSTCSNLYCHGNGRTQLGTKVWNQPGALNCTSCHSTNGDGMSGKHQKHLEEGYDCVDCHRDVIDAQRSIITPDLHLNGVHDVSMDQGVYDPATRFCNNIACHNNKKW